jgi:hypothetical protein
MDMVFSVSPLQRLAIEVCDILLKIFEMEAVFGVDVVCCLVMRVKGA